jgi:hypothetical protein
VVRPKSRPAGSIVADEQTLTSDRFLSKDSQLQDFRRSGSVEVLVGQVDLEALGNRLGNSLQDQRTYLPLNLEASRRVGDARLRGRRLQRQEQTETKKLEKSGLKVGNKKPRAT